MRAREFAFTYPTKGVYIDSIDVSTAPRFCYKSFSSSAAKHYTAFLSLSMGENIAQYHELSISVAIGQLKFSSRPDSSA